MTTAELKQQVLARRTSKKRRGGPKSTTIAAYTGVFLLVMSMVAIGYQPPQKIDNVANAAGTQVTTPATDDRFNGQPSVDQLVATNVAAGIAERADLPIATNVANLSVSLAAEHQLAQNDDNVISKPQIIQPTADNRDIRHYTAKAGDTVDKIAAQFGVSSKTIKWANNLATDAVSKGKKLVIPPTDGVIYHVKKSDTLASIASTYKANKDRIVAFNDLELTGLKSDSTIIIPGGVLPADQRPGYVSSSSSAASQGAYGGGYSTVDAQIARASAGNRYAFGNCTWYAYERRVQLGRPVGSFWGNAATWAMYARAAGYRVDHTPEVGAVAQWDAFQGGSGYAGHVAVVESVNIDGSITISEMNYMYNFNRVTSRTIPASSVSNFIH